MQETDCDPVYAVLNNQQIRLLHLHPLHEDGTPHCTLHLEAFGGHNPPPSYEALSYMWGPKDMKMIKLNNRTIAIRRNLYAALLHLAPDGGVREMWIDALCINQENISERTHQVSLMGEIYKSATKVVVWLGEADDASVATRDLMKHVDRWFVTKGFQSVVSEEAHETMPFILAFCLRDYWHRRWIIQEVSLASKISIHCGIQSSSWRRFRGLVDAISAIHAIRAVGGSDASFPASPFNDTIPVRLSTGKLRVQETLVHLCVKYARAACEEPKDEIFALHALALDCCREATPVDYSMDLSALWESVLSHFLTHQSSEPQALPTDEPHQANLKANFKMLLENLGVICQFMRLLPNQRDISTLDKDSQMQVPNPVSLGLLRSAGMGHHLWWITPVLDQSFEAFDEATTQSHPTYIKLPTAPIRGPITTARAFRVFGTVIGMQEFNVADIFSSQRDQQQETLTLHPERNFDLSIKIVQSIWKAVKELVPGFAAYYLKRCRLAISDNFMVVFVPEYAKIGDEVNF